MFSSFRFVTIQEIGADCKKVLEKKYLGGEQNWFFFVFLDWANQTWFDDESHRDR